MIQFFFESDFTFGRTDETSEKLEMLFKNESKEVGDINYIFCDDEYLLEINQKYLDHDFYTDIITFEYSQLDAISGDIYISTERVAENAEERAIHFTEELFRVMCHGALHLCGYDDKTEVQKKEMREKEDFYLQYFK